MRKLTLKGFLEQYLIELSLGKTSSYHKLMKEIPNNPRIVFPLSYYVYIRNIPETKYSKSEIVSDMVNDIKMGRQETEIEKLLNTFDYYAGQKDREDNIKRLMHGKIIKTMNESHLSTYKISKDLNLDTSNTNSFIKNCDCSRLSLDNVRTIYSYLRAQ